MGEKELLVENSLKLFKNYLRLSLLLEQLILSRQPIPGLSVNEL
jgi:hypothetical protein